MRRRSRALVLAALVAGGAACSDDGSREEATVDAPATITVTSTDFEDGAPVPRRFTCDGAGEVPQVAWEGVPDDAAAVALVMDDPDAPGGTFVHWVVLDMPAGTSALAAGRVPPGASQAKGSAGRASYFPPCPPSGTHRYRFTVYALSHRTGLADGAALSRALDAVESAATAQGRLVGTYTRD